MECALQRVPLEVAWGLSRGMGAEATMEDWAHLEEAAIVSPERFLSLFTEWLRLQAAGSRFGPCKCTSTAIDFVRRYVEGREAAAARQSVLTLGSVREERRFGDS